MAFIRNIAFDNAVTAFPIYDSLQNPSIITLDTLQSVYTIDIPCIGHDGQIGVEIDCPDVTLLSLQVFPLGVRVTLEVASPYSPGTFPIILHQKGRSTNGIYVNHSLVLDVTSIGVQYSTPYDIDPNRKTQRNKRFEGADFTAAPTNYILIATAPLIITLPPIADNADMEFLIFANNNAVTVTADGLDSITGSASINLTGYDSVTLQSLLPNIWLVS